MDVATQRALGLVLFWAYGVLMGVGLVSTLARSRAFRRDAVPPPRLWWRDVILLTGHAVTILEIMAARALGAGAELASNPFWWLLTSAPPLFAIGTYVYFELFVIGK